MEFGASIFFTDYSISPAELAGALEERGFESLWVAEHSHIPVPRRTPAPGGGELPKRYYDVMDPFVTLSVAAAVTKRLNLGTGVCLIIQRDTIQTAMFVASLDQVSNGRFLFGIGGGWNAEEIENHGTEFATRFKKMREQVEAMKQIWTRETAEQHGDIVDFTPMQTWPKPLQKPHPPVILGGAFPWAARRAIRYGDGWIPIAGAGAGGSIRLPAALSPDGRSGRPRSAVAAGHLRGRAGRCGFVEALSRSRRRSGQFPAPPGQGPRGPAETRSLGQSDAAAAIGGEPMNKVVRVTSSQVAEPAPGTWSNCLVVNGVAYLAGMTAGGTEGDEYAQAKAIFTKIRHLVEAAGGSMADILKVTIFVTDITQREKVWQARREFFTGNFPASTLVEVAALANPSLKVEIEAVACIGASKDA